MKNIDKKYHYLYKITNLLNGKYYYGIHSTNNLKDNYLGSGIYLRRAIKKHGKENFKKEIIEYFNTRDELALAENKIITKDILQDKFCMNSMYGGEGFNTIGMVSVKDKNGNYFKVFNDDSRYLSGELVGCTTGKANVKDKDGNTYQVDKNDIRILSGELVHIIKGKVSVKDKNGNTYQVDKKDSRYLSGELIPIAKNTVTVKDKDGNNYQVDKNDPKYLSGELVGITKGRTLSNETKKKLSDSSKGKYVGENHNNYGSCWINKDNENKLVKQVELNNYLSLGWVKGVMTINKKIGKDYWTLGTCWINKDNEKKLIKKDELDNYLTLGWNKGMGSKSKK